VTQIHVVAIITAVITLTLMVELLRRRQLREKYAALWLAVGVGVAVLGVFPGLLDWVAGRLNVADPPNLLFFAAAILVLVVEVHLSWELSRTEEKTRVLSEEVAFLTMRLELLEREAEPG
jgi:hypothetical protein